MEQNIDLCIVRFFEVTSTTDEFHCPIIASVLPSTIMGPVSTIHSCSAFCKIVSKPVYRIIEREKVQQTDDQLAFIQINCMYLIYIVQEIIFKLSWKFRLSKNEQDTILTDQVCKCLLGCQSWLIFILE